MAYQITCDTVLDLFSRNMKINLIRELRMATNMGLKEAKDKIEANYTESCILELFAPYSPSYVPSYVPPPLPKIKKPMSTNDINKKAIIRGMTTACNVWEAMGFADAFDACEVVLNNIRHNGACVNENTP